MSLIVQPDFTHNIISVNSADLVNQHFLSQEEIKITNIKVAEVSIPITYYIINNKNNKLYFNENGTDFSITLTNGNYEATSIANEIQTKMNSNSPGSLTYTVAVESISGRLYIHSNSLTNFAMKLANKADVAFKILGLQAIDSTPSTDYIFPYPFNLSGSQVFYIASRVLGSKLTKGHHLNGRYTRNDILETIMVRENPYNNVIWHNYTNRYQSFNATTMLDSFDIYIMDEDFNVLDFNNVNYHVKLAYY